jgi:serine phosphatase RsbU (regulator of sigma subunit)/tetratricopeptide (TPR) repeat protein
MKYTFIKITIFLLFFSQICLAQDYVFNREVDSLIVVANKLPNDTNKVIILNNIADKLWRKSILDSANVYAQQSLKLAEEIDYVIGKGNILTSIGIIYAIKGNYPKASEAMKKSLDIFTDLDDQGKIASAYNNLGNISEKMGDYSEALDYHLKSLKIKENLGDTVAMSSSYNNIGIALKLQGDNVTAIKYYTKALHINEKINNQKSIAQAYNNLGGVYSDLTENEMIQLSIKSKKDCYATSLMFYNKSLEIDIKLDDKVGMSTAMHNIGSVYFHLEDYEKSISYSESALQLREEIGDKSGQSGSLSNLSNNYLRLKKYELAEKYISQSLAIALEIGAKDRIKTSYKIYSEVDSAQGNFESAYEKYKMFTFYQDSIKNEESTVKTTQLKMQFEFDKKAAADSVTNAKFKELQNAEIAKREAELESKKTQQYYLFGGLFLVFVFSGFMYNRFRLTRKQNVLIELQKKQVEDKNILVEKAHHELSEKNKEILDSILYAKRIQAAILPPTKLIDKCLKKAFVFYKPKDIVAGDFYWLEQRDSKVIFAAADCTGHGVPGAMVSVVCNNGLNRSVREHGLVIPNEILDKTRELVIKEFDKSEEDVNDGMDISLCSIDFESMTLQWAGANNALILIRESEIIEIKPDKQPIGKYTNAKPFTNHELSLQTNDVLYLFTDGFYDQFGGEKGKKFLFKKFKDLLLETSQLDIAEQGNHFLSVFNDWKGENEQVDDVCIIGVRI